MHRYAFKSSTVRPTTTNGGATTVRTNRHMPITPQMIPKRFNRAASVILTALADRTRNITDILFKKWEKPEKYYKKGQFFF